MIKQVRKKKLQKTLTLPLTMVWSGGVEGREEVRRMSAATKTNKDACAKATARTIHEANRRFTLRHGMRKRTIRRMIREMRGDMK